MVKPSDEALPLDDQRRRDLRLLWIVAAIGFVVLLFFTGVLGPWIALWAWTLSALPLWIGSTRRRTLARGIGLGVILAVASVPYLLARQAGGGAASLGDAMRLAIFAWPVAAAIVGRMLVPKPGA